MEKSDITFFDPKAGWTVVERGIAPLVASRLRLLCYLAAE